MVKVLIEEEIQQMSNDAKSQWPEHFVALQTDLWSSGSQHEAYAALYATFFTPELEHVNVLLELSVFRNLVHSADHLADWLLGAMQRKNPSQKDISIVTSNTAANMVQACSQLKVLNQKCYAQALHRCVTYGLSATVTSNTDLVSIQDLIAKCKKLVSFVKSSTNTHKLLVAAARQLGNVFKGLKQEVSKRRNSAYQMTDSI